MAKRARSFVRGDGDFVVGVVCFRRCCWMAARRSIFFGGVVVVVVLESLRGLRFVVGGGPPFRWIAARKFSRPPLSFTTVINKIGSVFGDYRRGDNAGGNM